jgi:hypothetical protein
VKKKLAAAVAGLIIVGGAVLFGPVEQLRVIGDAIQIIRHAEYTILGGWHAEVELGGNLWLYDKRPAQPVSRGLYLIRHSSLSAASEDTIHSDLVLDLSSGEDTFIEFWSVAGDSARQTSGPMVLHFEHCDGSVPPGPTTMPDLPDAGEYRIMIGSADDLPLKWPRDEWAVTGSGAQHLWLGRGTWYAQVAMWSDEIWGWLPESPVFEIRARDCDESGVEDA